MTFPLRYNTGNQVVCFGQALDSTDGNTEETALTIANTDIKLWKKGATSLASKNSGGATHMSSGVYYATFDATDSNTLGPMMGYLHVSGSLVLRQEFIVLPQNVYDALYAGTDLLQVDTTQVGGTAATPTSDLATATALTAVGNNVTSMVTNGVKLSSTQSLYAPAKPGAAMALVSEYDAAKVAASATLVDQVKTVTDILNGMISSGAWLSSVYANMPTVVGPGSRPVAIGPIYKAGTTTPISGVEATIYAESSLASLPIDRKWSDLLGYAHTYLSPGTYYVTLVRSDEIFSGNPYTIVVPEA